MKTLKTAMPILATFAAFALPLSIATSKGSFAKSKHHASKSSKVGAGGMTKGAPRATDSKQTGSGGQPGGPANKN